MQDSKPTESNVAILSEAFKDLVSLQRSNLETSNALLKMAMADRRTGITEPLSSAREDRGILRAEIADLRRDLAEQAVWLATLSRQNAEILALIVPWWKKIHRWLDFWGKQK